MKKIFGKLNPDKIEFWDNKKNNDLSPFDISPFSHKKYHWICEKTKKHSFLSSAANISRERGCPYHSSPPRKIGHGNDLQSVNPKLAKEWHPTKNKVKPSEVFPSSSKNFYWICSKKHYWLQSPNLRSSGRNCPYCSNKKVGFGNDFETLFPDMAKEWHPTKNKLKPSEIIAGGSKKIFWICKYGHEWSAIMDNRVKKGSGCPKCSSQTSRVELYIFSELQTIFNKVLNREKINKDEIDIFIDDINLGLEYDGAYYHKNKEKKDLQKNHRLNKIMLLINIREYPLNRISKHDIFYDSKNRDYHKLFIQILKKIASLKYIKSKEINDKINDYIKNDKQMNRKYFNDLVSFLPGPLLDDSLMEKNPLLSQQWHPQKNGNLTPRNFTSKSGWRAWWKCDKGHEWDQTIHARSRNKIAVCPICSGYRLSPGDNDFQTLFPKIADDWHPLKNKSLSPDQFRPGSHRSVFWICKKEHEQKISIRMRIKNNGCKRCN